MRPFKRIFAFAADCHAPHKYYRLLWRRHIYEALRSQVDILVTPEDLDFSWARQPILADPNLIEKERARTSELLWNRIQEAQRQHGLDAVISYSFSADLALDVVTNTKALGVPWINFFCDSTHMFERIEALARVVSLNWFPESAAVGKYRELGVPYLCAPYAFNPDWLPDLTCAAPIRTAAFVGQPTSNRITQLGRLRLLGCPVEIRGHGWGTGNEGPFYNAAPARQRLVKALLKPNLSEKIQRRLLWPLVRSLARGPLPDAEFNAYVRDSLVLLGLNQGKDAQDRFASYLKFRDLEFPGYGCCYLTEHNDDLPRVFDVGSEVLTFGSMRDAAAQIRRLRRDPARARQIGQAGRRRVLNEHNWKARLSELAQAL